MVDGTDFVMSHVAGVTRANQKKWLLTSVVSRKKALRSKWVKGKKTWKTEQNNTQSCSAPQQEVRRHLRDEKEAVSHAEMSRPLTLNR